MACQICGQKKRLVARHLCSGCYSHEHRLGRFTRHRADAAETFRRSYEISPSGCWNWTGALLKTGYGAIRNDEGQTERAHRFAFRTLKARIPKGRILLHSCDNKRCVNPAHLRIGSHSDNIIEAYDRGLRDAPHRKLTDDQVREIRALHGTCLQKDLASRFGVSEGVVSNIINRRIWRNL